MRLHRTPRLLVSSLSFLVTTLESCMWVICKYHATVCKGLENSWIWRTEGIRVCSQSLVPTEGQMFILQEKPATLECGQQSSADSPLCGLSLHSASVYILGTSTFTVRKPISCIHVTQSWRGMCSSLQVLRSLGGSVNVHWGASPLCSASEPRSQITLPRSASTEIHPLSL